MADDDPCPPILDDFDDLHRRIRERGFENVDFSSPIGLRSSFDDGDEAAGVLDGARARFVEVPDDVRLEHLTHTDRFYARSPFRALRIVPA